MTLNGFEIEKYNIHGITEGADKWTCPECSASRKKSTQKCMSVFWDTGLGRCNHCGAQVQLHSYKKRKEVSIRQYIKPKPLVKAETHNDKVINWFKSRGISKATVERMRITSGITGMPVKGEFINRNAIMFPYFRDDELVNVKYRDGEKNFKLEKGAERILYNLDGIRTTKECIVVEGELDMLSYAEIGRWDTVSLPNGASLKGVNLDWLDSAIDYFENKDVIYIGLDNDAAGINTQKEIVRRLGADKCRLIDMMGYKDPNEILVNNGAEALLASIENAKEVPIENVSSVGDWESEYDHFLVNGMKGGYKTGLRYLDDIFSVYLGQFITMTGTPSAGKSSFLDAMCLGYNILHGWKVAYASPENKPNVIHASNLEAKLVGQWVNSKEQIQTEWHRKAKEHIDDNFKFIDLERFTLEAVLEKAKEMIRRYGIKVLVIDPYNKVRLEGSLNKNINDYTNDYLAKIDEFARTNDILIVLVAHPRKPGVGENAYIPTMYDIKGGGEFYDMSPHGLLVHRDFNNDATMIKVLKCKFSFLGENGAQCWYKWNKDNGRYSEFRNHSDKVEECTGVMYDNTNLFAPQSNESEDGRKLKNPLDIYHNSPYSMDDLPF